MIRTSHVGSFPFTYKPGIICKIMGELRRIGLDAPPYPQVRDFVEIYLDPLVEAGLLEKKNGFYHADPDSLIGAEPPLPVLQEAEEATECREGFKWLRGPVTGVFTLASKIYWREGLGLENTLLAKKDVVRGFLARYVRRAAEKLVGLGYNIIFFDEPILGVMVGRRRILYGYGEEDIRGLYTNIMKGLPAEKGIHVCGRVSDKLFRLLTSIDELRYINLEFHDSRRNLQVIDPEALERGDKILAPGVASSKRPVVEPVEDIRGLLKEVYVRAGGRIDLVSADCGFGGLSGALPEEDLWGIVLGKLKNIVDAVKGLGENP